MAVLQKLTGEHDGREASLLAGIRQGLLQKWAICFLSLLLSHLMRENGQRGIALQRSIFVEDGRVIAPNG